jgi:hypothetical protein
LGVHCSRRGSSKGSGVGNRLLQLLLLFFLVLFAQQAVSRLVYHPRHVVFTPVVSVLVHFFLVLLTILPGIILLLLGAALENFLSKKSFQTVFFVSAML